MPQNEKQTENEKQNENGKIQSLIIEELVIMVVSKNQTKPFKLSSNHLFQPNQNNVLTESSDKIYITSNISYNKKILLKLNYKNRIQFLFNKTYFTKLIKKMIANTDDIASNDKDNPNKKFEYNISITLQLLFPTYFPFQSNNANSYNQYIQNMPIPISSSTNIISSVKYSYIKIENKPYTIIKSVWLNDYINHPLYYTLFNEYNQFKNWKTDETDIIEKNIGDGISKCYKVIQRNIFSYNPTYNTIKNNINNITDRENNTFKNTSANSIGLIDKYKKLNDDVNSFQKIIKNIIKSAQSAQSAQSTPLAPAPPSAAPPPQINPEKVIALYNILNDIIIFINKNEGYTFRDILTKEFKINIKELYKLVEHAYALTKIQSLYFDKNNPNINMNISNQEELINNLLNTNYSKYVSFIKLFTQYLKPIRESTNTNFQTMIYDFATNNNNTYKFGSFNDNVNNMIYSDKKPTDYDYYIGANIITSKDNSSKKYYEIYVGLDIIDGTIDDLNVNSINCDFKGLSLGNKLENILSNQTNIIYQPEYYKLDNKTSQPPPKKQKGGITRKLHKQRRRKNTRKINYRFKG